MGWDCYQQPAPPPRHVERKPSPPRIVYRDRTLPPKIVYRERSWRDLPQDKAREWIKEQAQSFCGRYPKDEACNRSEQ